MPQPHPAPDHPAQHHLTQALAQAQAALLRASPNPRVGCVLVNPQGQVIGQGSTQQAGGPHAEVMALRDRVSVTVDATIREDETDVTLHLRGGKTLNMHIDHVIGSEHKPMSDRDMAEKFRALVEPVLPKARIEPLIDACWNINKLDDVSKLARLAAID